MGTERERLRERLHAVNAECHAIARERKALQELERLIRLRQEREQITGQLIELAKPHLA